jgi:hypothetical protein
MGFLEPALHASFRKHIAVSYPEEETKVEQKFLEELLSAIREYGF